MISSRNIYGFVLMTTGVVNSFLRGFTRTPVVDVYIVDRQGVDRGVWVLQSCPIILQAHA